MSDNSSFNRLVVRLKAGEQDAAREVFERYAARLLALASSRLNKRLHSQIDADDVLQSAFNSFFRRNAQGEYDLVNWDSLWGLLALITVRKCSRQEKRFRSERRGAGREFTLTSLVEDSRSAWEPVSNEPTPSQVMILDETLDNVLRQLSEQERGILVLHLQGLPAETIAEKTPCSQRTIQRTLRCVRRLLQRQQDE